MNFFKKLTQAAILGVAFEALAVFAQTSGMPMPPGASGMVNPNATQNSGMPSPNGGIPNPNAAPRRMNGVQPPNPNAAHQNGMPNPSGMPNPNAAHAPIGMPNPHADQARPIGMPNPNAKRFEFREHDVHRFSYSQRDIWRKGRWNNTCFGGRCGWWWFAGGQWYFYDRPVYPYPMIVSSFFYVEPMVVAPMMVPPPVVVVPPPAPRPVIVQSPPPQTAVQPGPQFHYYCDNPAGYYPAVQNCNTQFRQVDVPPPSK